jgi:hypothetical protein
MNHKIKYYKIFLVSIILISIIVMSCIIYSFGVDNGKWYNYNIVRNKITSCQNLNTIACAQMQNNGVGIDCIPSSYGLTYVSDINIVRGVE